MLHLEKGPNYDEPDPVDRSGLTLLWVDERIVVHRVEEHSPAEVAGIVEGDVLVQANGEPRP